jgi:glyoxylase-like metal-dependent hydrolase (beta-lactamase superfamily II)
MTEPSSPTPPAPVSAPIQAGRAVALSPLVHRLTAPNPGMMTGPGTNTYIVGIDTLAVIDPGPEILAHTDALVEFAASREARIAWILCTHTHRDHSPGSRALAARTGARVIGMKAPAGPSQDSDFQPDELWMDDSTLCTEDFTLTAIHTPGHASNHLCFLLEEEGFLFTGDHIMQGSTVVISPPDGDMYDYLASLERLKSFPLKRIAPGHGLVIEEPLVMVDYLIRHRLMRETKVVAALRTLGPATLDALVVRVYDDVPPALHPVARHSLTAHLLKLQRESRAAQTADLWQLTGAG